MRYSRFEGWARFMKLPMVVFTLVLGLILLVIAVPFGLVQLDIVAARRLRVIPSIITIIIGLAFLGLGVAQVRKRRSNK
jgi:ABC-type sulfate transport system permease component